jgi:hypothetical protein
MDTSSAAAECITLQAAAGFNIHLFPTGQGNIVGKREFFSMQNTGVFDKVIWIDRSDHLPPENINSMSLQQWMADHTIDNNGTLEDLEFNVHQLLTHIDSYSVS